MQSVRTEKRCGSAVRAVVDSGRNRAMKNTLSIVLLAFCLFLCAWANADEDTPLAVRLAQTASGRGPEYVTEISEG